MNQDQMYESFIRRACELGAAAAKVIDPKNIITAAWVLMKCQFGCSGYNSSCCCPPRTPTPGKMREIIDCYTTAILIHGDDYRIQNNLVANLEREIFLAGYHKALGLGAGPCKLCQKCSMEKCIHPENARPSMEACGIDVYATAGLNGFPIEVVKDRSCEQNSFGLILVE
ncbi:DUF2284 domain-containing protein [Phosphitispora fastidiosa]|uniref:DUF2284 domain-containing protein n=1 Tax=Phosphitispora fastidiosa TaxID=2837202 RepID=UPI001E4FC7CE|nr:DUF2284 domain-containing protein [Phosphitispora fastidiosa]MBU7005225.1 putative metal-binding protein [Phosphitispora fastidiosa]